MKLSIALSVIFSLSILLDAAMADDTLVVSVGSRLVAKQPFTSGTDVVNIGKGTALRVEPFTWVAYKGYLEEIADRNIDSVHPRNPSHGQMRVSGTQRGTFFYISSNYGSAVGDIYVVVGKHDHLAIDGAERMAVELQGPARFRYWLVPRQDGGTLSRSEVLQAFDILPPDSRSTTTKPTESQGSY